MESSYIKYEIVDNPLFSISWTITFYEEQLENIFPKLLIDHPPVCFKKLDDFYGYYCWDFPNMIYINSCKQNPEFTLFHELGHHIWRNNIDIQEKWNLYVKKHTKRIKNFKVFQLKLNRLFYYPTYNNSQKCKLYQNYIKFEYSDDFIPNYIDFYTKIETLYYPNNEEIFCETFAACMTNQSLHKSNPKIIFDLLQKFC